MVEISYTSSEIYSPSNNSDNRKNAGDVKVFMRCRGID